MMAFVQTQTPANLVGKVIAVMLTVSMCRNKFIPHTTSRPFPMAGFSFRINRMLWPKNAGKLIIAGAGFVFPIGISQMVFSSGMVNYMVQAAFTVFPA